MPDNAGTLILHHNHTPANHHHHDHNNTAGSSSRSRLLADSPHQPYIFSASQQGQDSNLAPHLNHSHSHSGHGFDQLSHEYDGDEALDGDEDRQSDEGSEGEPGFNEIEFWLQRCSICFDARLDFCLEYCRDQFCRDCFQRYVKEVVSNSWGLNVTKIKCPVCQDVISLSEWTQYVDQSTLAQYQQYNQPYRSFSRFCNDCEHELVISEVDRAVIGLPVRDLVPIFDRMSVDLKALLILGGMNPDDPISVSSSSSSSSNLPHTKPKRRSSHSIRDTLAREIRTRPGRSGVTTRAEGKRQVEIKKALVRLSKRLSSIETRPEQWKELQFLHVRWLRWDWCNHCNQELCLQCGVSSHHESQDCSDYMRSLIAGNNEASNANTIQWKLANTNPCPNCCILIHRDDGCNKVDCMLCGYRFCWICREAWGAACGFFKCGRQAAVVDSPNADGMYASMDVSRGEDQIPPLDVSHHLTGDADQGQAGTGASPQDQRRNRAENVAGVISEMVWY
ncbi:hypothetical protein EDD21DRAFT_304481 [Dissophora ornata]|nr:hypothetical protein EDD21DRAFT_304481 [Dissophora ornata]